MPDEPRTLTSGTGRRGGVRAEQPFVAASASMTAKVFDLAGRRAASPDDLRLAPAVQEILEPPLSALGFQLEDRTFTEGGKSLQCTLVSGPSPFCLMQLHADLLPAGEGEQLPHDFSYLGFFVKEHDEPHPLRFICEARETLPVDFDDFFFTWRKWAKVDAQFVAWSRLEALQQKPDPAVTLFRLGLDIDVPLVPQAQPQPAAEVVPLHPDPPPADDEPLPGVFISYSHKDDPKWIGLVRDYLKPLTPKYEVWDDSAIEPGDKWNDEIAEALAKARIVVLLVSQHFENSSYIQDEELGPVLENAEGGVKVFPVAVGHVAWEQDPMKALLAPYQWAYGPPTKDRPALSGLTDAQIEQVLVNLRIDIQHALEADD